MRELYDAVFRYETSLRVMQGGAEGLALFGEFDAAPGPFKCRAPVLMWCCTFSIAPG